MDHAYHITGNQRHVTSCEKPHLSNCLTHFSSLLAPERLHKMQNILNGCCEAAFTRFLQASDICKRLKETISRSRSYGWEKAQRALFTPVNMGILWQVQRLGTHSFLPAAGIKVVCLEVEGRDLLGGSFPHRQGTWQLRSGARHITALKISSAFDARHRAVIQSVPSLEPARIKPHHVLP